MQYKERCVCKKTVTVTHTWLKVTKLQVKAEYSHSDAQMLDADCDSSRSRFLAEA